MAQKKYVSLSKLSTFLDNLRNLFVSKENLASLETVVDAKANAVHTHDITDINNLQSTIDEVNDNVSQKSQVQLTTSDGSESFTEILSTLKIHKLTQEQYDEAVENGFLEDDALYLTPDEDIDLSGYATVEQLKKKADAEHSHNDIYYTEVEVDTLLQNKSDINHNHDSTYDAKGSADEALIQAKSYADNAASNAANAIKNELLNGADAAYDTLKELGDLIDENVDAVNALETIASGKADASHTHNDIYYTEAEIDGKVSTINTSIATSLNEAKLHSNTNLNIAKVYTDNMVAQKTQVQFITWEADD